MNDIPGGSEALLRSQSPLRTTNDSGNAHQIGTDRTSVSITFPSDPLRQENRLPIRILKMLTAHSHLLHPEYLQPLTSAPVSIELDAKKSPLALLAQTCSQIGKPDPPSSSKLASLSSGSLSDKDSSSRSSKSGEQHQPLDDKSSFKPYSKSGGECRKDGLVTKGPSDKNGFRVPNGGSTGGSSSFPPHSAHSPSSGSPPLHTQSHRRSHSPASQPPANSQATHVDSNKPGSLEQVSSESNGISGTGKKDTEHGKTGMDSAQLANSSHVRASANSSNASSASSPRPESKADHQTSQPGLASGHIAPVSPFKPGHSVFPLPPANMGYHGSIVGAYAGYPSQFVPGLDHKSSLSGLGLQGKHPSSSPLTGASPPSLMQGLCRDPYCLTYPNASHLGGSSCSPCPSLHDPSSALKSGFPLMYSSHHLHSLHPGALSSSTSPSLSHPLYTYGFMLPNESQSHACNWVSMGGPCDKRFATSEELLAHLRTHTALSGGMDSKLLSSYSSASAAAAAAASCHLHLPPPGSPGSLPSSFSLRGSPGLSLARYHPYSKAHLPGGHGLPMHSLQASSPYYSPYALYSQRLGSASALGYQ